MCTIVGKWLMVKIRCDWRTELDMFSHDCDINPQSHLLLANHIVKHDVLCEYLNMYREKPYFIEERSYSEVYRLTTNNSIGPGSIQTNRKYCSAILTLWVDSLNTWGLISHNSFNFRWTSTAWCQLLLHHKTSTFITVHVLCVHHLPGKTHYWSTTYPQYMEIAPPTFILQMERAGHTDTIMRDSLVFTSVTAFTRFKQICHDP
jgi:hypothetical protein